MLLDSIALVRTHTCLMDPGKIVVVGEPSCTLDGVIPYLAMLPNVIAYDPGGPMLILRRAPGWMTLLAHEVQITHVDGVDDGLRVLSALAEAINATWEGRDALAAVTSRRRAARPLDVWNLLPQTNCGACGESTCMAFAFALLQARRAVPDCPPLANDPALADRRAALDVML